MDIELNPDGTMPSPKPKEDEVQYSHFHIGTFIVETEKVKTNKKWYQFWIPEYKTRFK